MKNKKSKKKNKAFMDFDSVCLGIEEDIMAYENSLNEIQEISDAEFFEQFNMVAKEMPPAPNSIVSQKLPEGERKTSKSLKKDEKLSEYALAERIAEEYTVGMYFGTCFIRINGVCELLSRKNTMMILGNMLSKSQRNQLTTRMSEGVYKWISALPNVINNKLEILEGRVLFKNGLFDISTGERVDAKNNELVTVRINAKFNNQKRYETPEWDAFLDKCANGRRGVKELIWSFLGYLLLPGASAKNFFVLGTAPDSGKSLLAEFVRRLVAEESVCSIAIDDFNNDFVAAQVVGKVINFAMDIPGGMVSKKSVSALKLLTGRDLITINAKYEYPHSYRNFAKLVFASNDMITIRENDSAFWDRMIIIPFLNSVPEEEQDPDLLDKLWQERNGIVNKAIFYAKQLIENGYQFPCCYTAEAMKSSWVSGRCPGLSSFVKACCEFDQDAWCATMDIYNLYVQYCNKTGRECANVQMFAQTLCSAYGLKNSRRSINNNQRRGISGITLKNI